MVSNNMDNSMRMTGFATGMDVESMVNQLMEAERQPLIRMKQDQRWLELQRDAYREMNTKMSELDSELSSMQESSTYTSKSAVSSNEGAVTASASAEADTGNYSLEVNQLATAAINPGTSGTFAENFDPLAPLSDQIDFTDANGQSYEGQKINFSYQNSEGEQSSEFTIEENDSLSDIFSKISDTSDGNVRAFYDDGDNRVIMERTEAGDFNDGGNEMDLSAGFFGDVFGINNANEQRGDKADFTYNGINMTSNDNSYEINGVSFDFHSSTNGAVDVSVGNDVDAAMEQITGFIDKYNETIDFAHGKMNEERNRDYPPLTERQREEMSEREVELWEEKSQSGMLRNDSVISSGLSSMRSAWYQEVDNPNSNEINSILDVGISTSSNWRDNGKLEVDEAELRQKLQEDPEAVMGLFHNPTGNANDPSRGLTQRVEGSLDSMMESITNRAGNEYQTAQQYTLGREMADMSERMTDFERRMQQAEQRYWDQFTRMEQAVQQANAQSSQLQQQLGGMM
ncbi:flagellar hook-associated protein 2 [Alkalibacillus sp. S2W]|uniref:flagellar hook-associated protein 2 n=1 Tax=Alkalibacillus sp. S2W TaxID=3386553 RepID=UPI00398D54CE